MTVVFGHTHTGGGGMSGVLGNAALHECDVRPHSHGSPDVATADIASPPA
jgi:hypothetical protein